MKPFETTNGLQVGNLIKTVDIDMEVQIASILSYKEFIYIHGAHVESICQFSPIKLTIERAKSMLEANGFECKTLTYSVVFKQDCKSTDYIEVYMNGIMSFDLINYDFKNEKFDLRFFGQIQGVQIRYIHEFQNIVQLITGVKI